MISMRRKRILDFWDKFYQFAGTVLVLILAGCVVSQSNALPSPSAALPISTLVPTLQQLVTPSPSILIETAPAAYPGPVSDVPTLTGNDIAQPPFAYPAPDSIAPTMSVYLNPTPVAYPAPSTDLPALLAPTDNPYPGPGGAQAGPPVPTANTAAPTADSPYPAPQSSQSPVATLPISNTPAPGDNSPYPPPQSTNAVQTTSTAFGTPEPTQTNGQSSPQSFPSQESSTSETPSTVVFPSTMPVIRTNFTATDPSTVKLSSGKVQLIVFYADWCPICKSMAPVLNLLGDQYTGKLIFSYLDVDNSANLTFKTALGYRYPLQIFLLDGQGKVLKQWSGYVGPDELQAAFNQQGIKP